MTKVVTSSFISAGACCASNGATSTITPTATAMPMRKINAIAKPCGTRRLVRYSTGAGTIAATTTDTTNSSTMLRNCQSMENGGNRQRKLARTITQRVSFCHLRSQGCALAVCGRRLLRLGQQRVQIERNGFDLVFDVCHRVCFISCDGSVEALPRNCLRTSSAISRASSRSTLV